MDSTDTGTGTVSATAPRPSGPPPSRRRPRLPVRHWLTAVAVSYGLAQLLLVLPRTGHALGWDETVYVSQTAPWAPAAYFSAPRSRGVSLLVAPVLAVTDSVLVLRLVLVLLSSAALYAAFRAWRPLIGPRDSALAALLLAGLWTAQHAGSQVMPNLWTALAAVAGVAWFLRVPAEPRARWWLAALLAAATAVRLPDAGWVALPLLGTALVVRAQRSAVLPLCAGAAVGALPWAVEAYVRFGGVVARLRRSSEVEGGMSFHMNVGNVWRTLNGPQLCRPCHVPLEHPELTLWWCALPLLTVLAVVGALRGRGGHPPAVTVVPVLCAVAAAVPYLFLLTYSAPRFLLPSYALLAPPLAVLLGRVPDLGGHRSRPRLRSLSAVTVALAAAGALHTVSQEAVVWRNSVRTGGAAEAYRAAAGALHALGVRPPCAVTGPTALPVAFDAGCASVQTHGNNRSVTPSRLLELAREIPFALLVEPSGKAPSYARGWSRHPLPGGWWAHLPPGRPAPSPGR